ncbi:MULTISPECIES: alpha/beta hydrolase [Streptomyces]|uniref:Esterase family protein n=1 Tax=Streptomyces ortus TaxID=2867268 RepID=A0ABT3VHY1_9ACTN|nr:MULTISPECIES: alpha/beta hydrolase family protein [Streptomyces]MCX4238081.1 esterase family protein [Streptomyces ortus]
MTRKRRCAALAVTTALLGTGVVLTAPPGVAAPAQAAAPVAEAAANATVVGETWLDARTVDLTIASPAVGASLPVRVVLPTGYAADPDRARPVLYLLQGAHDDHTSWTRETDVVDFLAGQDVLTVMPSSGPTGIPTDWWNYGSAAAPDYETFQVEELPDVLRQRFGAGTKRAVAGVSTGGYGALAFAARHPGTFGAAASYSGILDTTALGMPTVLNAIVAREQLLPLTLWGSYLLNRDNWNRHNPYARASALQGTGLYISQGSGLPGGVFGNLEGALLEGTLWAQAHRFTAQLDALGIPAQVHFYSGGAHAWPNWRQEFKASWPTLAKGLGLS